MGVTGTERQEHFIALANAHAEDFKKRVAQHDRQNSFPFENVEAMKASGYTNMTVPAELGGGGVSVLDLSLAQERLARGDGLPPLPSTCTCSPLESSLTCGARVRRRCARFWSPSPAIT